MKLYRGERQYLHMPFFGLSGATPTVIFGEADAVTMEAATGYEPPPDWSPPTGYADAEWWRVLIAGPDATSNPVGTVVVTVTTPVRFSVTAGDEIDILPDDPVWITLI